MVNLYYLSALGTKRLLRLAFFMLSPGVVTILCHGNNSFSPFPLFPDTHTVTDVFSFSSIFGSEGTSARHLDFGVEGVTGPPPRAKDDQATTAEETPVVIAVLENDESGTGDDKEKDDKNGDDKDDKDDKDDDDDKDDKDADDKDKDDKKGKDEKKPDFDIDPATVDLNPDVEGIQSTRATQQGVFVANQTGNVTFTPEANYFGVTSIQYTVSSKSGEVSNKASITLTVTNVNDAPRVGGQNPPQIPAQEGKPVTITLGNVVFSDPDNQPPGEFSLVVLPGARYSVSGKTVTPQRGSAGVLPVLVQVNDGISTSEAFSLSLLVARADNIKPVITGQTPDPLTTPEDTPLAIQLTHLKVTDPDDDYPEDFTLKVQEGTNYTVSGNTITPALNFFGELLVPVKVNDGESNSEPYEVKILVTSVNDQPVVTGQEPNPLTTGHNQPVTIALSNLKVTDPDHVYPTDFTLTVLAGENYTVSGTTVTPVNGFAGMLSVNVTANDPMVSSEPYPLQLSVAANSAPVITGQTPLSTNEETPLTLTLSNFYVSDSDDSYPTGFTFRLLPGDHYTVEGDKITPAVDFAGTLTVPLVVNDGTTDSEPFNLQITVHNVNDAPRITGQIPLSTPENQPITLALSQLTVSDPDNDYPGTFTLSVLAGDNYSVSGHQVTPSPGFNGTLSVGVFVNDGTENSNIFSVSISVTPTNDPPVITGQRSIEIPEDHALTLTLQDLTVEDPDNTYPDGFTLLVQPGEEYTYSGTTITPAANVNGTISVNVIVNDGVSNSEAFPLQISVTPVNDAPSISGQQTVTTSEDVSKTIDFTHLVVQDPDNTYPTGFTLFVFPGDNYTLNGNTVIPATNYSGTLIVQVQVSDGLLKSNIFDLALQVEPVNDAPVITGQNPVETAEDTPVTIQLSHLTVLDVDNSYPAGFTLVVSPGTNYTASGSTITPATDFNGTLNVTLMVNDGTTNSAPFTFQIKVGNANDAPVITGQTPLTTDEEKPVTLQLSHLTVSDPDNAYPTGFSLLVSPGINYTVSGNTIIPAVNFAGVLTIPVRVNDGVNNSSSFDFKLQVNQINDAPSFAAIPNQQLAENVAAGSVTITGISKGPLEDHQLLTFVATSSNTAIIENLVIQYDGTSSTGMLSYTVKPNASGVVTVTLVAIDNGSNVPPHQNSYTSSFQVEVLEINSAPTLNVINDVTLLEDAEQQNVGLTGISAGPGEEQPLMVTVVTDKPGFFDLLAVAYTSPNSTGLLSFKPKPNVSGTAQISVTVTDGGPGTSPHVNAITRTFKVIIQPVNDPPVFTSQPVTLAVVNEAYEYVITAVDPDGEPVAISATTKPGWASITSSGNGKATLAGKPLPESLGHVNVELQAKDAVSAVQQSFTLYVNVRPTVTSLSVVTEEDNSLTFPAGFFQNGYTDLNENPLTAIQITALPGFGKLLLSEREIQVGDTIAAASLSSLVYVPQENYFGNDSFGWKASDGYHLSLLGARVDVSVLSVNDPPQVILEKDTLHYEVNGEPAFLSPLIEIIDPDDDSLSYAAVGFHARNYRLQMDVLEFANTANIRGNYNYQTGTLEFNGKAPVSEYVTALRSVRYLYQNTIDPIMEPKLVFFKLNDGESESPPKDKVIILQYTFIEFAIPSGFTPNGDHANDTWVIDRPGGGLEEMDNAVISVYNKQGVLVYRAKGFDEPWDGTMNGQLLPADTYFFTIDLQLRNKKTYKGIVTILR